MIVWAYLWFMHYIVTNVYMWLSALAYFFAVSPLAHAYLDSPFTGIVSILFFIYLFNSAIDSRDEWDKKNNDTFY